MKKILMCKGCGARLTTALDIRSGKDPMVQAPLHKDRAPLTDSGIAFKSYAPITRSYGDEREPLDFIPQYWINPDDLTDAVGNTRNSRRLSGCCGLAGSNGPNQVCRCGAEIGTLRTDCWSPRIFIPEPGQTWWDGWSEQ